ncbi:hypothetical protein QTP86_005569 [Hemibagrus guttatus]|nr:hypothetical protein QTP86_005569 [Hemibagrus guttatus]
MQSCVTEPQDQSPHSTWRDRPAPVSSPEPAPEPMNLGASHLTPAERQRRLTRNLCLYCGALGHALPECPIRPPRPMATTTPYQVRSITGKPLGRRQVSHSAGPVRLQIGALHVEETTLLVLEESTADIILGRPWLEQHNPILYWSTGEVLKLHPLKARPCTNPCKFLHATPPSVTSSAPREHLSCLHTGHGIALLICFRVNQCPGEGSIPCPSRKRRPWRSTFKEALDQGYIRPSTSPAASSFFFMAKKDGGLRPCIDYRALNRITGKFRYPLPLVPAALEHLRGATLFTKLDLRSAYNLIRIREGDEWKTAFIIPTGHYEYLVMPYGLANAPSVFQDFIHEVLREFLHRFVLVYIDDILIYSRNLAEHRQHVAKVLERLRKFQLFLKAEKCSFHQTSVQFCGYQIDSSGIKMDEGKVTAV